MQCLKGLVPNIMIDFYCCCIFLVGKKEGWSPVASQTWLVSFIFRAVLISANPPPKKKKHEATFPLSIVLAGNHLVNHTQSHSVFQLLSVCISKKKVIITNPKLISVSVLQSETFFISQKCSKVIVVSTQMHSKVVDMRCSLLCFSFQFIHNKLCVLKLDHNLSYVRI